MKKEELKEKLDNFKYGEWVILAETINDDIDKYYWAIPTKILEYKITEDSHWNVANILFKGEIGFSGEKKHNVNLIRTDDGNYQITIGMDTNQFDDRIVTIDELNKILILNKIENGQN